MQLLFLFLFTWILLPVHGVYAAGDSVFIEELTWPEIRDKMKAGADTVIVPTGGTEQGGPQIVLGKHNSIIQHTAEKMAIELGTALVAPVVPFTPAGRIDPPEGHMRFPGTISLREEIFGAVLEDIARSMKQHGFRTIVFIGDHGGNQAMQAQVAEMLSREWREEGVQVLHVGEYYDKRNGQLRWIKQSGLDIPNPTGHAGFMDTSEAMALDKRLVRTQLRGNYSDADFNHIGASGDSTQAAASYGRSLLALKVKAGVQAIRNIN